MGALSESRLGWTQSLVVAALAVACAIITACSSDAPARARQMVSKDEKEKEALPVAEPSTPPHPPAAPPRTGGGTTVTPPPAPDLYDPDTIPRFALTFDDAAMEVLRSTDEAQKKTWVHARFEFGNVTFADVGVRRKGSRTWRVLPEKTSLKVKFNKWVKGQKLYGLEELTLNNMVSDPTYLHERLAYHTFRAMGLAAPRTNTAHLTINGEDFGIFANLETPDENFLPRAFGAKARSLYEVKSRASTWLPAVADGFEIDIALPGAAPGARPDLDSLLQAVATAKDDTLLDDLGDRLHTRQFLQFCAAEALTGTYDGYAFGTYGYSHNYFVAGDTDGKFALMPWSTDLSFADRGATIVDASSPIGATVFARCKSSPACWEAYKAEVDSLLAVYEALDLGPLAKKWNEQIDPLVRSDPKRNRTIEYYEKETILLYDWIAKRPSVVRAQLGL